MSPGPVPSPADGEPQRLSPWLGVTGLLLLATLLAAAFVQARQHALLNLTVRAQDDYLAMHLVQVEVEYLRLREQLRRDPPAPSDPALQLRYDIFVSRVALLGSERARRLLEASDPAGRLRQQLDGFTRHADRYLGRAAPGVPDAQAARALLAELETLEAPIHDVMLAASHRVAEQVTERQAQVRDHNRIGLALTGFLLAVVLLFAGIALRQMRALDQRRRHLAQLADQLREARIEAEAASAAKSDFLADMSHELRTPLHGLMGMLALVRDAPRHPSAGDWLATADDSAQHLLHLLDDILDLSKLESGALTLCPAPVALAPLLREVQALLQPLARAKGLALQVELDPALPEHLLLDGTRVRQVLYNLLANALKFSEAGAVRLRCHPVAGAGAAQLVFDVSDTGIGMDRATLDGLFRRFGRSDDPRARRQGGTGLGLAISRDLARLMGGEIGVRSAPGQGSVFSFRCPLRAAQVAPEAVPDAAPADARPLQVLVAEDHPVNRLYLAALLARLGHPAVLVEDGQQALQALRARRGPPFDLVLMDVHMPVMDGVAATRAIRALPAPLGGTCVVALTADVFADTRQRCLDAGADEVATKPLSLGGLRALLARRFGDPAGQTLPEGLAGSAGPAAPGSAPAPAAAAPDGPAQPGLLDANAIHGMRELMGETRLPLLYGDFFRQAEDAASRMRAAMREANPEALRRSAHHVRGAALNLGLPALAEAAALLNREAGTLAAAPLALAVQRYEETIAATRALCAGEGLLGA